jgi:hypothetical protein
MRRLRRISINFGLQSAEISIMGDRLNDYLPAPPSFSHFPKANFAGDNLCSQVAFGRLDASLNVYGALIDVSTQKLYPY